jgi:hypothetical protein
MRPDAGFTNIPTAGTAVKWSSDGGLTTSDRFLKAEFKAPIGNTGPVYIGIADVSATGTLHGYEISPPVAGRPSVPFVLNPADYQEPGQKVPTMKVDDIHFDAANNNDKVSWAVVLKE